MATRNQSARTKSVIAYEEDKQPVRLDYDTWTPRPHFIVVQCQRKQDATPVELQATYEIINNFLRANPQFDQEAILSFHCGKWYQQHTSEWHAHLCVPQEPYLAQARIQITEISNNNEWKGARTVDDAMAGWYKRKLSGYTKYKNECVDKGISNRPLVDNSFLSTFDSISNEFKLVWTFPAPRIGIVAQSPTTSSLASLYTFMSNVRVSAESTLARLDRNFANFGCHLCLYVSGQHGTNVTCRQGRVFMPDGTTNDNPSIVGYIQMDESQYLQLLPSNLQQQWLNEFGRVEHFVRT